MTISFDEWWDSNYRDFTGMSGSARWVASLAWNASRENIEKKTVALPTMDKMTAEVLNRLHFCPVFSDGREDIDTVTVLWKHSKRTLPP